jgi:Zn finger protein HypA/HybF involved in hydrogenase expression
MTSQIKALIITGAITFVSTLAITMLIFFTKDTVQKKAQADIAEIKRVMQCENNSCDRFKGKDAKELESRLMDEINRRCGK